ncbi:unnamed protein product [Echinostoma caproni]|uniref:Asteroid domain-containing protein n=1 Tax=Echinostoma caproni TaxID=27848 RepID=A0A183B1I3_9TREM|nr:unnamed protein product [Echinostoma caproni]
MARVSKVVGIRQGGHSRIRWRATLATSQRCRETHVVFCVENPFQVDNPSHPRTLPLIIIIVQPNTVKRTPLVAAKLAIHTSLESVFFTNPLNFECYELQNSFLVIDGDDLFRLLVAHLNPGESDTECLQFALEVYDLISRLQMSNLDAIFLFEGIAQDNIIHDLEEKHPSALAPRAQQTLLGILKYYSVHRFFLNEPVSRAACSLAARLQCPVLGSKNAYYIISGDSSMSVPFIPLRLLNPKTVPNDFLLFLKSRTEGADDVLSAYAFYPRATVLAQLDQNSRCMLGVSWNAGLIYHQNQLSRQNPVAPMDDHFRLNNLIEWIQQPNQDHGNQLTSLLYAGDSSCLTESCALYMCLPHSIGDRLCSLLQSPIMADSGFLPNLEVKPSTPSATSGLDPGFDTGEIRLLSGWPPRLTAAYRRGEIPLSLIASMYLPKSSQQRFRLEPSERTDFQSARPLIVFSACILLGMEQQIRNQRKLVGLNESQSEVLLGSPKSPQSCSVSLEPYPLNFRVDRTDAILKALFGLPKTVESVNPDWLFGFAFAINLWYRQTTKLHCTQPESATQSLHESAVALAITSVAVATVYNTEYPHTELRTHYTRVTDFVLTELRTSGFRSKKGHQFPTKPKRDYEAIQSIYQAFRALVALLDSILHPNAGSEFSGVRVIGTFATPDFCSSARLGESFLAA